MPMMHGCYLFLCAFLCTISTAQSLKAGGINVVTTYETYYTPQKVTVKQVDYRRTCTETCILWIICKTKCWQVAFYRLVNKYKLVKKTRPKYVCRSGWRASGDDCTIPICANGCLNGRCTSPNKCNCTPGWSGATCANDIDECNLNGGFNHGCQYTCVNMPGSYKCSCPAGHFLTSNGKNCTDHDECANNTHNCGQGCNNFPGGYNCTCYQGYTLNSTDLKSCNDIDECDQNISGCDQKCSNNIGNYTCSCKQGYYLASDGKTCNVVYCAEPTVPQNGFVYTPCDTRYGSQCHLGCARGYFLKGNKKMACVGQGVWERGNQSCQVVTACEPNPCQNGGKCQPISNSRYTCSCRRGYVGDQCASVTIHTPKYPILTQNVPSPPINFQLPSPQRHVILRPRNRALSFTPSYLMFNSTADQQSLTVTASHSGIYSVQYTLSGAGAVDFHPPWTNVVFVKENKNRTIHTPKDIPFPNGCHQLKVAQCPSGSDVIASSTSSWNEVGAMGSSTNGMVALHIGTTTLPLSLVGVDVITKATAESGCSTNSNVSIEELVESRVIPRVFLKQFKGSFPRWLTVVLNPRDKVNDAVSLEWKGYLRSDIEVRKTSIGKGQPLINGASFLLLMVKNINMTINKHNEETTTREQFLEFAVNLCDRSSPSNIILRLTGDNSNMNIFKRLENNGWFIDLQSLQISKMKSLRKVKKGLYWNGRGFEHVGTTPTADLALVGHLRKHFVNQDMFKCFVTFDGTMLIDIEKIDEILEAPLSQKWLVDLYGNLNIDIEFVVEGSKTNVTLNIADSVSYVTFGDAKQRLSLTSDTARGIFLRHQLDTNPFLHSDWQRFLELSPKTTVSALFETKLQQSEPDIISSVSMVFRGNLMFGPLRFENQDIQMRTTDSGYDLLGTGDLARIQRGIFVSAPTNPRVYVSSTGGGSSRGSFQNEISFFGFQDNVNVTFSQDGLQFTSSGKLHGLYDVTFSGRSNLTSWAEQVFIATGEIVSGRLKDDLNQKVFDYGARVVARASERVSAAEKSQAMLDRRLEQVLELLRGEMAKEQNASQDYERAQSGLNKAILLVENIQRNVSGRLNLLQGKLDSLCNLRKCRNICRSGVICTKCSYNIMGKEKRICLEDCSKIETQVVKHVKTLPCSQERCQRIYLNNGLFKNNLKDIFTKIRRQAFSYGIKRTRSHPTKTPNVEYRDSFFPPGNTNVACQEMGGTLAQGSCAQDDDRDGHWDCSARATSCNTTVFGSRRFVKRYRCEKPCESHVTQELIPKSCCQLDKCAFKVVNLTCIAENALCSEIRRDALANIAVPNTSLSKLVQLENAKASLSRWRLTTRKSLLSLTTVQKQLNATLSTLNTLKKARNATNSDIKQLLAKMLKLRQYLDGDKSSQTLVEFGAITFNAEMKEEPQWMLPLQVRFKLDGQQRVVDDFIDFKKIVESLHGIAKRVVDMYIFASPQRSTINVVPNGELSPLIKHHRLCSEHTNYMQLALNDITRSLYNITLETKRIHNDTLGQSTSQDVLNITEIFANLNIDVAVAASFRLNVTRNVYLQRLSNDTIFVAAKNLQNEITQDGYRPLLTTSKFLYRNWYSAMENIFKVVSQQCLGFQDCIRFILDGLNEMYLGLGTPEAGRVQKELNKAGDELISLTEATDKSVEEALAATVRIRRILKVVEDVNLFCIALPNITQHPAHVTELAAGEVLSLTCYATGDHLTYQWSFNDTVLAQQRANTLLIKNTTRANSGTYTCDVSNHVVKETSTPSLVIIHTPPAIITQPRERVYVVESKNASLYCDARSTDSYIRYQWWFLGTGSDSFVPLANKTFSRLNIERIRPEQEGWYYCNVTNKYGFSVSRRSWVKLLRLSFPVPVASLSVFVVDRDLMKQRRYRKSSPSSEVHSMVLKSLQSVNGNSSVDVRDLVLTTCKSSANSTSQVCTWTFNYVGANGTYSMVVNASYDLVKAIGVLTKTVNSDTMNFTRANKLYLFDKNSVTVDNVLMMCPVGQQLNQQQYTCVECQPGYYGVKQDNLLALCLPCSVGLYQADSGQLSCIRCPEGFTTTSEGSYGKHQCKVICGAGYYGVINGGVGQCITCPKSTYQPYTGQFSCLRCPGDTVTMTTGSNDILSCIEAPTTRPPSRSVSVTTQAGPETEGTAVVAERKGGGDGAVNYAGIIGGVVGGCILLAFIALLLLYKKRRQVNRDDVDKKAPRSGIELRQCHENPAYRDDNDFDGVNMTAAVMENPTYATGWAPPPPPPNHSHDRGKENPLYETSGHAQDERVPGEGGVELDRDESGDIHVVNPLYEAYCVDMAQSKDTKLQLTDEPIGEDEA